MLFSYKVDISKKRLHENVLCVWLFLFLYSFHIFFIRYELRNLWTDRWRHINFPFNSDPWRDLVERRRGRDHVLYGMCRKRKLCWDILRLHSIHLQAVLISELHSNEYLRHTKLCKDLTRYKRKLLISYSISFALTSPHAFEILSIILSNSLN